VTTTSAILVSHAINHLEELRQGKKAPFDKDAGDARAVSDAFIQNCCASARSSSEIYLFAASFCENVKKKSYSAFFKCANTSIAPMLSMDAEVDRKGVCGSF
jgi:hypothetical protein